MTRYFFDTADGDRDTDDTGVELDGDAAAINEAIRYAGSMLSDQPDLLAHCGEFVVRVHPADAPPLATIRVLLDKA